jgi:hypothetical protein
MAVILIGLATGVFVFMLFQISGMYVPGADLALSGWQILATATGLAVYAGMNTIAVTLLRPLAVEHCLLVFLFLYVAGVVLLNLLLPVVWWLRNR